MNEPGDGTEGGGGPASAEDPTTLKQYVTSSGNTVAIRHKDPSYKPTDLWLEAQRRQSEAGGPYSSEVVQGRVLEIVAEIRSFDYDRYSTPMRLSKKWGYSLRYTRQLCAEAIKVVREEVTDSDYVTTTVCESLDKVIRDNVKRPNIGNQQLVVKAAKVWSEIAGIRAPVELRLSRGSDDLPNDPEQLRQLAASLAMRPGSSIRELMLSAEVVDARETQAPVDSGEGGAPVAGPEDPPEQA